MAHARCRKRHIRAASENNRIFAGMLEDKTFDCNIMRIRNDKEMIDKGDNRSPAIGLRPSVDPACSTVNNPAAGSRHLGKGIKYEILRVLAQILMRKRTFDGYLPPRPVDGKNT